MGKKRKKVDKSAKPKAKTKTKKALPDANAKNRDVSASVAEPESARAVAPATTVDLWFDPVCPWTWIASRWLLDVETVRSVKTCFHVMSRSMLNSGTVIEDPGPRSISGGHPPSPPGPARVALAVGEQYGQEQLSAFYTAIGTRIHDQQQGPGKETIDGALADVGLPPELAELAETDDNDDVLQASHHAGIDPVGHDVDTPVIHINGVAFVGPVFSPQPRGEEAGRVFDGLLALASHAGFVELRRARPTDPSLD